MDKHDRIPLGYIELESGRRPIYALYDFFLNFTFNKKENWEDLRLIINILLDAFIKGNPKTAVKLIEDEIIVKTQYEHLLENLHAPKRQDFMIEESRIVKFTYIEVQNSAFQAAPVEARAVEYSVLSISQNPGRVSNHVWLLAEDVKSLLHGGKFSNYVPTDEVSGKMYPNASGIMFVSLRKLSEEQSVAGELASFLLGKITVVKNDEVKRIAETLKKSCETFCNDKGVKKMMTIKEYLQMEARWQGMQEGRQEGMQQGMQQGRLEGMQEGMQELAKLIKLGMSVDEALIIASSNIAKRKKTHPKNRISGLKKQSSGKVRESRRKSARSKLRP